jgi:hypothetical protein
VKRWALVASVAWVVLACAGEGGGGGGGGGGGAAVDPRPVDPGAERGKQKHGKEKAEKGKVGKGKGRRGRDDEGNPPAELVDAFAKDCHHHPADEQDECTFWRGPTSGPDPFGCETDEFNCQNPCRIECEAAREPCAEACDTCKGDCEKGDQRCIRRCAVERAECRQDTLDRGEACAEPCADARKECDAQGQRKIDRACPNCEAITRCRDGRPTDDKTCQKRFPDDAEECFQWGWCSF